MSEDDLLARATGALKERYEKPRQAPAETRSRILMSLQVRSKRRAATMFVLAPIAAVLVVSTAWAAATGRLPVVWRALGVQSTSSEAPNEEARTPAREPAPLPLSPVAPRVPEIAEAASAPIEAALPAPEEKTIAPPRASSPVPSASSSAQVKEREKDPADALYEAAHRAHFAAKDPGAAVAAWDRYLAAAPRGRFAPEARYNRALALLRLGRREEAVRELAPFADGRYGNYRREEARALTSAVAEAGANAP